MSANSKIEWCSHSWNPTRGCEAISSGCQRCYADTLSERYRGSLMGGGEPSPFFYGFDPRLCPHKLDEPLGWRKSPAHIFVNSMSDLLLDQFGSYVHSVLDVADLVPVHCYLVLTKRAHRLREVLGDRVMGEHIWWGVTVEDRKALARIRHLRELPGATRRFLSIEPLLEDLGELDLTGIDWVIVGGESGPGARPIEIEWVRSIRNQCFAAGVPFHFKQWGGAQKSLTGRKLDGLEYDARPPLPAGTVVAPDARTRIDAIAASWADHELTWRPPTPDEIARAMRPRPTVDGPADETDLRIVCDTLAARLGLRGRVTFGGLRRELKAKTTPALGVCESQLGHSTIKIRSGLTHGHALDVLRHELAHAVVAASPGGGHDDPHDGHGGQWGVAYARVYREYARCRP